MTKQRSIPSDKGNGSTQSIKHRLDSSKTKAGLDRVMPEAELSKIKQFSPLFDSITRLLPLVGTCTHQGLDLKLPLKLRLPLNI